jgi:ribosome biogenesis GTPase A
MQRNAVQMSRLCLYLLFRRKVKVAVSLVVSAHSGEGMQEVAAAIEGQRMCRDVYVIGAANVGKSAFVSALLKVCRNLHCKS